MAGTGSTASWRGSFVARRPHAQAALDGRVAFGSRQKLRDPAPGRPATPCAARSPTCSTSCCRPACTPAFCASTAASPSTRSSSPAIRRGVRVLRGRALRERLHGPPTAPGAGTYALEAAFTGRGRVLLAAANVEEEAWEAAGHGLLTAALICGLAGGTRRGGGGRPAGRRYRPGPDRSPAPESSGVFLRSSVLHRERQSQPTPA